MNDYRQLKCPSCGSYSTVPRGIWDEKQHCLDCSYIWEVNKDEY